MKSLPALILVQILAMAPIPAIAQTAFETMVGDWRGSGNYVEGLVDVQLRCRFTITGDASAIHMAGRCASSLGGEDFTMDFERGPDGTATVQNGQSSRADGSAIDVLTGQLGANGLVVNGAADDETITVQLLLNDDGTLNFATRETSRGQATQAYVTLTRR